MVGIDEVTSATEDVAIPSGEAVSTDISIACDFDICTSQHVIIVTSAKDRAINLSATDGDKGAVDVGVCLAQFIGIIIEALTATKHVSVQTRAVQRPDGSTANVDRGITPKGGSGRVLNKLHVDERRVRVCWGFKFFLPISHGGHIATTKDVATDGAALDVDIRVTIYTTRKEVHGVYHLLGWIAYIKSIIEVRTIATAINTAEVVARIGSK